ncbi:MAG: hypothetical protein SF182_04440 [Deltaproteobacteria bacterium]|nr:hypothetical protein [Deltaproteobacteria bacterium]
MTRRALAGAIGWAITAAFGTAAPATAAPDHLIAARSVIVQAGGTVKFVARGPLAVPSGADDPTVAGAALRVFDTESDGGFNVYALPASGWRGLGDPAGSRGYLYRGSGTAGDPCRTVRISPTLIKAKCTGPDVTLTPPFAGQVGVQLLFGDGGLRYCASFGGRTRANDATRTRRSDAAAPATCPDASPQGTRTCSLAAVTTGIDHAFGTNSMPHLRFNGGALEISCGAADGNREADCDCRLTGAALLAHIPQITDVCLEGVPGCSGGRIDCDGGAALDTATRARHDIGACSDHAGCDAACDASCAGLGSGFTRRDAACEGVCAGGANDGLACATPTDCPGGRCPGATAAGHSGRCNCLCAGRAADPASPAGTLSCEVGLRLTWEFPPNGVCGDATTSIPVSIGPLCVPLTSSTATGLVSCVNGSGMTLPAGGPAVRSGAGLLCSDFAGGQLSGLRLAGYVAGFDTNLGDLLAGIDLGCQ